MAIISIKFRGPLKNFHLFGDDQHLSKYSNVNQAMHNASINSNIGASVTVYCLPSIVTTFEVVIFVLLEGTYNFFCCKSCSVFKVNAIDDKTMKNIETNAIILNMKNF